MRRAVVLAPLLGLAACAWTVPREVGPTSLGRPAAGRLALGVALAERGPGWVRLRRDDRRWAGPLLVETLMRAAAAVQTESPGAPLRVADLSGPGGGRIEGHRSHRSGRDADVLFYVVDAAGRSVASPGFVHFGNDLVAIAGGRPYRLDVERTWQFVRALLDDPAEGVEWLFVSHAVEERLLAHAVRRAEPVALIVRAGEVLHQPYDSEPHDDHLHLRVMCTPIERAFGCADGGPLRGRAARDLGKLDGPIAAWTDEAIVAALRARGREPPRLAHRLTARPPIP